MSVTYDDKGIYIKKLFKSRELLYSDIRSVVLSEHGYVFITKGGEVINAKQSFLSDHTALFSAIRKYNILFKNEEELKETEDVYSIDEVNKMIEETKNITEQYGGNLIRDKFGPEYDIDLRIIDEDEYINMYLRLTKNGDLVKDIPEESKYESSDIEPYSFDNFVLAFLVEWDGTGKYGVTEEMKKREACEKYLEQMFKCFFEDYKR